MAGSPRLSKSRFTTGLQCHRQLWWRVYEPDAPELVPDAQQQALFDQGTRVGELARSYVPGGYLVDLPHDQVARKVEATRLALDAGVRTIYEASFLAERVFAAIDILQKQPDGFVLIEVKSSTHVKPEHIPDAAVQVYVLERAGLPIMRVELMHLDRGCAFPDLSNLFAREDVTRDVRAYLPAVPARIAEQLHVLAGPLPDVAIGAHCNSPYECPFRSRCWAHLPPHHVTTLYYAGKKAWDLQAQGIHNVADVPLALCPNDVARRQCRAVHDGAMIVEPTLRPTLDALLGPLAFLDFETVAPAVPVWDGCRPFDAVPVQFSCHHQDGHGVFAHDEWLADGPGDPRAVLAEKLIESCSGARTVLAYNASFERSCLQRMASALDGALAHGLGDIESRLEDMLPLVRDHLYHPDFRGSFSLKRVLPLLVPELTYENLAVAEGGAASVELERMLLRGESMELSEKQRMRSSLLEYCKLDTWATVRLLERLRELADGGPVPRKQHPGGKPREQG